MVERGSQEPPVCSGLDPGSSANDIASWLVEPGGERVDPSALMAGLCEKLIASGVPLSRASFGLPTLHPQVRGSQVIWRREGQDASEIRHPHGVERSSFYLDSPVRLLHQGAAVVRRRLDVPTPQLDFRIFQELAAEGATDYVATPLRLSSGLVGYISWVSDRPGGFSTADLSLLDSLLPLLALRIELEASYQLSQGLLETYLGKGAAKRVLAGDVKRGQGSHIRAAILLSDLRGFTAMADRLPADDVIVYLNDYFDIMATQVEKHQGEVLKFIGDGMLAVFDVDESNRDTACCQAVHAAIGAVQALAALNRDRPDRLDVGIALHLGDVVYGNIGAAERLDFTVIGAAVNEAARIETLCRPLQKQILASASFATSCKCKPLASLGLHHLRSVCEPQELFTIDA